MHAQQHHDNIEHDRPPGMFDEAHKGLMITVDTMTVKACTWQDKPGVLVYKNMMPIHVQRFMSLAFETMLSMLLA